MTEKDAEGKETSTDSAGGTSANVFITFYWYLDERERREVCYKASPTFALDKPINRHIINAFQAGSIDKFQVLFKYLYLQFISKDLLSEQSLLINLITPNYKRINRRTFQIAETLQGPYRT